MTEKRERVTGSASCKEHAQLPRQTECPEVRRAKAHLPHKSREQC